jgi:hypothetical protein
VTIFKMFSTADGDFEWLSVVWMGDNKNCVGDIYEGGRSTSEEQA